MYICRKKNVLPSLLKFGSHQFQSGQSDSRQFSPKFNSSEPTSPGWTTSDNLTKKNPHQLQPLPLSSHYSNSNISPRKLPRPSQRRFESWRQFTLGDHAYVGDLSSKESGSNATTTKLSSSAEYNSDPTTIFRETTRPTKYQPSEIKNSLITNSIQGGITSQTNTSEEFRIYPPRYSRDTFKRHFSLNDECPHDLNFDASDENFSSPRIYPSEYQSSLDFRKNTCEESDRFKSWRKYNLEDYIYVGNISKHSRDQLIIYLDSGNYLSTKVKPAKTFFKSHGNKESRKKTPANL